MDDFVPARSNPSFLPLGGAVLVFFVLMGALFACDSQLWLVVPVSLAVLCAVIVLGAILMAPLRDDNRPGAPLRPLPSPAFCLLAALPVLLACCYLIGRDFVRSLAQPDPPVALASLADWRMSAGVVVLLVASFVHHALAKFSLSLGPTVVWLLAGATLLGDLTTVSLFAHFTGEQMALGRVTLVNRLGLAVVSFFSLLVVLLAGLVALRLLMIFLLESRYRYAAHRTAFVAATLHHGTAAMWMLGYLYFVVKTTS
jgi:hypothetical protein